MRIFLTLIKESIFFAFGALLANKLRTFLSLLGITIGIFAIITVFTIVDSLEKNLRDSIDSLGSDVVFVHKWPWTFGPDYPWWKYMNRPLPKADEATIIRKKLKSATAVAFHVNGRKTVKNGNNSIENVTVSGVSYEYDKIKAMEFEEGRYFTEMESEAGRSKCVLGNAVAAALFRQGENAIGKTVKIFGRNITVVGVLKREGESLLGNSMDAQVLVPVNYVRNFIDLNNENIDPYIAVKALAGVSNEQLKDELTGIMRGVRKLKPGADDDFALNETKLLSQNFDGLFDVMGLAGAIIGGFSILVGGFGIANIMFVSVKERTNLIGIQKSLGAKNFFILIQFLSEAVFLSLLGGLLGLGVVFLITLFAEQWFGMEITLSISNVILGLTISFLIGVIAGFIPSYGASQLDPVEAIRSGI